PTREPPVFLRARRPEKVKTSGSGKGLRLAGDAGAASSVGVVPRDARIVLTGEAPTEGHWAKTAHGFAKVKWQALEGGLKVDDPGPDKRGVVIRAEGKATSPVIGILPKGTTARFKDPFKVRFEARTAYHEIAEGGFVPVDRSTFEDDWALTEPDAWGKVVQP